MLDVRTVASTVAIDPPAASKINLAIADLVLHAILFFPTIWITWRHGKAGMVCWPIFLSYFPLRFVSDAYQISHRHDPEIPNTVVIMTNSGSIACLTLALIGIIYEVYVHLHMTHGNPLTSSGTCSSPSPQTLDRKDHPRRHPPRQHSRHRPRNLRRLPQRDGLRGRRLGQPQQNRQLHDALRHVWHLLVALADGQAA